MIVKKFLAVKFPSVEGPDLYGLAVLAERWALVGMKNGRQMPRQDLIILSQFNPDGLLPVQEFNQLYSEEKLLMGESPLPFDSRDTFRKNKDMPLRYDEILALIQEAIKHPIGIDDICGKNKFIELVTDNDDADHTWVVKTTHDIVADWLEKKLVEKHKFSEIYIQGHILSEEQREMAEKDFFVITCPTKSRLIQYVKDADDSGLQMYSKLYQAIQFLTENEAFAFIEKYKYHFGDKGYEVIEVKGMTMEEGLAI